MTHINDLLRELRTFADNELLHFTAIVQRAFSNVSPVFLRDRYNEFFFHCAGSIPGYLANVILANADAESKGSQKLFTLWKGASKNPAISRDVLVHSKDEARHSRIFVSLLDRAFPNQFSREILAQKRRSLFQLTDSLTSQRQEALPEEHLMDHLVQMNMGEIRTRAHMLLLSPVIYALAPETAKSKVRDILEGLVTDEIRHICYTARFIESWCESGDGDRVRNLYNRRLKDFHVLTVRQTEASVASYGQGRFPDLLEI